MSTLNEYLKKKVPEKILRAYIGRQLNSTQESSRWFMGKISADRKKITDPEGAVYDLQFTGNPKEYELACRMSNTLAVVNATEAQTIQVDGSITRGLVAGYEVTLNPTRVRLYIQNTESGQRFEIDESLYPATFDGSDSFTNGRVSVKLSSDGRSLAIVCRGKNDINFSGYNRGTGSYSCSTYGTSSSTPSIVFTPNPAVDLIINWVVVNSLSFTKQEDGTFKVFGKIFDAGSFTFPFPSPILFHEYFNPPVPPDPENWDFIDGPYDTVFESGFDSSSGSSLANIFFDKLGQNYRLNYYGNFRIRRSEIYTQFFVRNAFIPPPNFQSGFCDSFLPWVTREFALEGNFSIDLMRESIDFINSSYLIGEAPTSSFTFNPLFAGKLINTPPVCTYKSDEYSQLTVVEYHDEADPSVTSGVKRVTDKLIKSDFSPSLSGEELDFPTPLAITKDFVLYDQDFESLETDLGITPSAFLSKLNFPNNFKIRAFSFSDSLTKASFLKIRPSITENTEGVNLRVLRQSTPRNFADLVVTDFAVN